MSDLNRAEILGSFDTYLDKVRDLIKDHPEAVGVILVALQRLQGMLKEAGLPGAVEAPTSADEILAMTKGAISNLKASQSTLEQFVQLSLDGATQLIDVVELLVGELS